MSLPTDPGLLEQALGHHRAGRLEHARIAYEGLLRHDPAYWLVRQFLGIVAAQEGRVADAFTHLAQSLSGTPADPGGWYNLGRALEQGRHWGPACRSYEHVLSLDPAFMPAYCNLGHALERVGRVADASRIYQQAIERFPALAEGYSNLGRLMSQERDVRKATGFLATAAAIAPDLPEAWLNWGALLYGSYAKSAALVPLRRALRLRPKAIEPREALANVAFDLGLVDETIQNCTELEALSPAHADGWHKLAFCAKAVAEPQRFLALHRRGAHCAPGREIAVRSVMNALVYDPDLSPEVAFEITASLIRTLRHSTGTLPRPAVRRGERPLRIGYISADFRAHPVALNMIPVIDRRDRTGFHVTCYAHATASDSVTDAVAATADQFVRIESLNDEAAAERICADRIDILVYLAGRFDENRPFIALRRPAPIQISLHDVATSGMTEIDYLIADPILAPRRSREHFTERVLRVPHFVVHEPIADAPDPGPLPLLRNRAPVFGNFGNPLKLNDLVLKAWGRILGAIPGARLVLGYRTAYAYPELRRRVLDALAAGPGAVTFVESERGPRAEHLALYREIDVALDSFPFSGSTSSFEALWMGVPVLTCPGDTMVSRWTASMLSAAGLSEIIVASEGGLVETAQKIIGQASALAQCRRELRAQIACSPLCDAAGRARQFERLYRAVWKRHRP